MPAIHEKAKRDMVKLLDHTNSLSATKDEWTSTCAKFAEVSLIVTFLTEEFKRRTLTIASTNVDGTSSAKNVAEALEKVFLEYPTLKDKIIQVTSDQGSVMIAMFRDHLGIDRRSRALHRMHNSVRDNIPFDNKKHPANKFVNNMKVHCKKISGHFAGSNKARQTLGSSLQRCICQINQRSHRRC